MIASTYTALPAESRLQRLRAWFAILAQQFRLELAIDLHYRAFTAIWMISAVLDPIVFLVVWTTVARAQGGSVDGMTPADFAAYYIAVFIVGEMTYSWNVWDYENYVKRGDLSAHLLRPVHPFTVNLAANLANKSMRMVIVLSAALLMALLFRPAFHFAAWSLLLFLPALLLAAALYFACDLLAALSAFWWTSTSAVGRTWDTVFLLLSGYVAPLQLFPAALGTITWVLPFRWMLAFPVELLLNTLTPYDAMVGLGMQVAWLAVVSALLGLGWKVALRHYAAVGG